MRFILSAVALSIALPVYAADMPVKAQPAPPAVATGWAGAYVGITAGYGWDEIKATAIAGAKADPNQFMPGGVAGYRWGKNIIFGLELNGIYAGHSDTVVPGITGKTKYLGDMTAQIGLAVNPSLLIYVGAGPALANSEVAIGGVTSSANNFGWVGRAGFDTKLFNTGWAVGVAYAHYELGDSSYFGGINASHKTDVVQGRLTYQFGTNH